jgi:GR25 family glycosyltransferase involved in LPS biosynthesis
MIPIFVITLPQATQKQELMKKRMQSLGIPFEFVWGVDGRLLSQEELQKAFDKRKSYNYLKWYRNRTAGIELTRGEIGAVLAHRKVYQKMVDEHIERAIVMENGTFVSDDFESVVEKVVACIKQEFIKNNLIIKLDTLLSLPTNRGYCVKLKNIMNKLMRPVQIKIDNELAIIKTPVIFGGAVGYYIDNAAAQTMLSLNYPVFITSDEWNYFARFITVRALNKTIVREIEGLGSDIWKEGYSNQLPIQFKYRYIGVIKKAIMKIYLLLWR